VARHGGDAMSIDGQTRIIAHIGHPTTTFRSPAIYNPYFARIGLNVAVVPMGVRREDGDAALPVIFRMTNVSGALITMPLKIDVVAMLDEASPAVTIAGSCNAVRIGHGGRIQGHNVDGEGFVRALARNGVDPSNASALVVGAGGVGSAIAASLSAAGIGSLTLVDTDTSRAQALAARLHAHAPRLSLATGPSDPAAFDIVVNATPLGMNPDDPLPFDPDRLSPGSLVGEVVLAEEMTPLLRAAAARGCKVQTGLDMLFEMIPAYLEFFGLPTTTSDELRAGARL
jgi:shikimate dehydrogenase